MNPISDSITTYTPRSGHTATVPGCFTKTWYGEEFLAEMRAKAAVEATAKAANTVPAPRKELTTDDIAELASKYDPKHMSQEEYDAFLEDMVERGVLREDEIRRLGYNGTIVSSGVTLYCTDFSKLPGWDPRMRLLSYSIDDANGDMLDWMLIRSIMEPVNATTEAGLDTVKETNDAHKTLYSVLDAIQIERGR